MITAQFKIQGMTCASCASSVESMLSGTIGVKDAVVNYADSSVNIKYDENVIDENGLSIALSKIGYKLLIDSADQDFEKQEEDQLALAKRNMIVALFLAAPVFVLGMFFMHVGGWVLYTSMVLTFLTMAFPGRRFYVNAVKRLRFLQANMDTLVALSTFIAFSYSCLNTIYPSFIESFGLKADVYFESAAVIIAFILLGKYFEEKAKNKSGKAIKDLMSLQPNEVSVIINGEEKRVAINDVKQFDRIMVQAGDRFPVDGIVAKGNTLVDESMISGEPEPVHKEKKDEVYAGTLNQTGLVIMLAQKVGKETLLAQIVESVKKAQGSKAPAQKKADKIASVFVPSVIIVAAITAAVWLLFGGLTHLAHAINSAVAVLVIACPCALGLATPTALMVGMGRAAQEGILIKDAEQLETAAKIKHIVFDKTGTLTQGKPTVLKEYVLRHNWLNVVLAAEEKSQHPLADAIIHHLKQNSVDASSVVLEHHETVSGLGVKAKVNNEHFFIGKPEWVLENSGFLSASAFLPEDFSSSSTLVYAAKKDEFIAAFAVEDEIKPEVKSAIEALKAMGVVPHLLTGDRKGIAEKVAKHVGINHVIAEVMPAQKGDYINGLKEESIVAMVGDGINDAEALALANVSFAMANGTDIAIDVAGITLMHGKVKAIIGAINISAQTAKTINQNLFWAFIYNLICIPLAAGLLYPSYGFLLSPMIAGAAMSFSSISVVLNSLRLRKSKL